MKPFFITSSGTNIGKTFVTTALAWQLSQQGHRVNVIKPVISGFHPESPTSDTAMILKSLGQTLTPAMMARVSPWRFSAALSPDIAAKREGRHIDFFELLTFCKNAAHGPEDYLLIEGVGGVMVPLDETHTFLDLMSVLGFPVIVVVGSYLGTLSHSLTALYALEARHLNIHAVVVSESETSPMDMMETVVSLRQFMYRQAPVLTVPRLEEQPEMWKSAPDITEIVR